MKIPGLDDLTSELSKQASSAETMAAALDRHTKSQYALAEANNRLAQAMEDQARR